MRDSRPPRSSETSEVCPTVVTRWGAARCGAPSFLSLTNTPFAAKSPQFRTQRSPFSIPMSIWFHQAVPEALTDLSAGTMVEHLGIEFLEVGEDSLTARMPVDPRTIQPAGLLHGGASVALAETLGSVAATCALIRPTPRASAWRSTPTTFARCDRASSPAWHGRSTSARRHRCGISASPTSRTA